MSTLSPVWTRKRVAMFSSWPGKGRGVAEGVGLGCAVALGVGVGVGVAVALGVAVGTAVGAGVGVGVAVVPPVPKSWNASSDDRPGYSFDDHAPVLAVSRL